MIQNLGVSTITQGPKPRITDWLIATLWGNPYKATSLFNDVEHTTTINVSYTSPKPYLELKDQMKNNPPETRCHNSHPLEKYFILEICHYKSHQILLCYSSMGFPIPITISPEFTLHSPIKLINNAQKLITT